MKASKIHQQITLPGAARTQARSASIPARIGPYRIESLLSKGGMSYLYLGLHPVTSEPLAIKVLSPKFLKNRDIASRFLKEAQIIALTNHPNIVKLYGQGSWEQGLYIAMEFIRGISLRQFIQNKSLSQRRALEIILQVAYALCHLHTHGVIHRDVKPENILIQESGEVKVIDFGIAQLHDAEQESIGAAKAMMGTPAYMSPEQKLAPHLITYASDIYALGVITYELVLGRLSHGIIHLGLLPKQLKTIIEKALKPDLNERYQDIVDFITDISQYLKQLSQQDPPSPEEASDEVRDMIHKVRASLIVRKPPKWSHIDFGFAMQEGSALSSVYLDFFRLPENRLGMILAEPLTKSASALFHCATLRGMMQMATAEINQSPKRSFHPINLLHAMNTALSQDAAQGQFAISLLLLSPDKDLLSFIACGPMSLWHISEGSHKVRYLTTPNQPLGSDPNLTLLETASNWHSGDTLFFHNLKTEEAHHPALHTLSLQSQAEFLLQRTPPQPSAAVIVALNRLF